MKHLKPFQTFENTGGETLKSRLISYYTNLEGEYDEEEIQNVLDILEEQNDNIDKIDDWDKKLLLRLIDDEDLYDMVNDLNSDERKENPFD